MTRRVKFALTSLLGVLGLVVLGGSVAHAQGVAVDANRATRGKVVWERNGCYVCHAFGRQLGAPDLMGVTDRREQAWLRRWLKETSVMLASDAQARALLEQYRGIKMPQFKLTDTDIEAVIHFMAQESQKMRKA